ncbi:hypothetical protein V6N12_070269 [Hibiscus sabdariffa]|uniref:Uncharacterized protein n=1 Tax=Hibiscus sabdariffa TaxID=183260 RepID=A0ABR2FGL1_9ROSI
MKNEGGNNGQGHDASQSDSSSDFDQIQSPEVEVDSKLQESDEVLNVVLIGKANNDECGAVVLDLKSPLGECELKGMGNTKFSHDTLASPNLNPHIGEQELQGTSPRLNCLEVIQFEKRWADVVAANIVGLDHQTLVQGSVRVSENNSLNAQSPFGPTTVQEEVVNMIESGEIRASPVGFESWAESVDVVNNALFLSQKSEGRPASQSEFEKAFSAEVHALQTRFCYVQNRELAL